MITYSCSLDQIGASDLEPFFGEWLHSPSPEERLQALRGSSHVLLALDDGRLVGFINALTDGYISAFIALLEVLPSHQGQGIGSELVRRMLLELSGVRGVDVMCDPQLQPFYARFGLSPCSGMVKR